MACAACPPAAPFSRANSTTCGCPPGAAGTGLTMTGAPPNCSACGAGTYAANASQTACAPCAPGAYGTGAALTACAACAPGAYAAAPRATACVACAAGEPRARGGLLLCAHRSAAFSG